MRKLEYLRQAARKIEDEEDIYYMFLPKAFYRKGAYDAKCSPVYRDGKLAGIFVENFFKVREGNKTVLETELHPYLVPFPRIKQEVG